MKLHLGCGRTIIPGWVNLDLIPGEGVDCVADLDDVASTPLPFDDDTFDEIVGLHLIEHLRNPLAFMAEMHRVAQPGGTITFTTPYGSSDDAWEDPTHVRPYFMNSWGYFGQPFYWRADYGYRGDWDLTELQLSLHPETVKDDDGDLLDPDEVMVVIGRDRNVVSEMTAILRAVKPAREPLRELMTRPHLSLTLAD